MSNFYTESAVRLQAEMTACGIGHDATNDVIAANAGAWFTTMSKGAKEAVIAEMHWRHTERSSGAGERNRQIPDLEIIGKLKDIEHLNIPARDLLARAVRCLMANGVSEENACDIVRNNYQGKDDSIASLVYISPRFNLFESNADFVVLDKRP